MKRSAGKARRRGTVLQTCLLTLLSVFMALPIYIALVNAFKPSADVQSAPLAPALPPILDNLRAAASNPGVNLGEMYRNSLTLLVCATVFCVFISALAAYYLARSSSRAARFLRTYFLIGLMVPYVIVYIPLAVLVRRMGIPFGVPILIFVFASGNISFATFMYTNFIRTLPREIEESAAIDGASKWRTFWSILFPLLRPCTATVCIFVGLGVWNDFMTPLLLGQVKTITVGIYTAIGPHSADWGLVFAFVLFATLPVVAAYLCAQNQFIDGLTAGATKG
jgi:raffinose/stachyose/melibiose transport system permease protein